MIRTLKLALCYNPANSRAIGYYSTQQNFAYNAAVDVLNQEPELPKGSGRNHPDALNKRITMWLKLGSHGVGEAVVSRCSYYGIAPAVTNQRGGQCRRSRPHFHCASGGWFRVACK